MGKEQNFDRNWHFLLQKAEEFGIKLDENQLERFNSYYDFLNEYNSHTNLVSSSAHETVMIKHFADSLSIGLLDSTIRLSEKKKVLDIGTGGGFPGVPIVIAYPETTLYAVDSVRKKTDFLTLLSPKLGISEKVEILNTRGEELLCFGINKKSLDIGVSRAVSRLNVLLEYNLPYLKIGGYFVAYKSKTCHDEILEAKNALKVLGGEVVEIKNYKLSGEERNLILIAKTASTPEKFPRKTGNPAKNPL